MNIEWNMVLTAAIGAVLALVAYNLVTAQYIAGQKVETAFIGSRKAA
jgi:hypothetical protein